MQLSRIQVGEWYETKKGTGKCLSVGANRLAFEIDGKKYYLTSKEVMHEIAKGEEPQQEQEKLASSDDGNALTAAGMRQAAQHLAKSAKGLDALQAVLAWLDNSGCSLDHTNQEALLTLLEGAWGQFAGTARDEMREALAEMKGAS